MVKEEKKCFDYTIEREGVDTNLIIDTEKCEFYPSIEESEDCMSKTIELLTEVGSVSTITFKAERNYVYPFEQTKLINEIARAYVYFVKEKNVLKPENLGLTDKSCMKFYPEFLHIMRSVIIDNFKHFF